MAFMDAVVVKGQTKGFSCTIQINENSDNFSPLDLSLYSVRLRVLGAPTNDAKILLEKVITGNTDIETVGQIDDPENGSFTFVISADDTNSLGLGAFPLSLALIDADSLEEQYLLTEGGFTGEFNKLRIVQV